MGKRVWTPERVQELLALIEDGHHRFDIAKHFGVKDENIARIARNHGTRFKDIRWSIQRISRTIGVSAKTLAKDFNELGIRHFRTNEPWRYGPVPFLSHDDISTWLQSPQAWVSTNGLPLPQKWQDIITTAQAPYTWISVNEMRRLTKTRWPRQLKVIQAHNWTDTDCIRKRPGNRRYLYRKDVVMALLEKRP